MFSALVSRSSGPSPGPGPGRGDSVVFLGNTLYSQIASPPRFTNAWVPGGNPVMD